MIYEPDDIDPQHHWQTVLGHIFISLISGFSIFFFFLVIGGIFQEIIIERILFQILTWPEHLILVPLLKMDCVGIPGIGCTFVSFGIDILIFSIMVYLTSRLIAKRKTKKEQIV